jgi:D-lactate dehydrogenase
MNIVICTPSKEEIDFFSKELSGFNVHFFDKNLDEDIVTKISDCEIFSGRIYSKVDKAVLDRLPNLKFIVTHSTGYDHIDIDACKKRGVSVLNIPSYGERSIAEFGFGMILSLVKNIHLADRGVQKMNFDTSLLDGEDLFDKKMGIIGTGKIGREMIKIAKAFGMQILAYDIFEDEKFSKEYDFKYVTLDYLLENSDIISLHVPNIKETHHFIDDIAFSKMKKGSYLLNTARGGVIDIEALARALEDGKLRGAALDVIEYEKILFSKEERLQGVEESFNKLREYNVLYTPHMAAHSMQAQQKKLEVIVGNIKSCVDNKPINIL